MIGLEKSSNDRGWRITGRHDDCENDENIDWGLKQDIR